MSNFGKWEIFALVIATLLIISLFDYRSRRNDTKLSENFLFISDVFAHGLVAFVGGYVNAVCSLKLTGYYSTNTTGSNLLHIISN